VLILKIFRRGHLNLMIYEQMSWELIVWILIAIVVASKKYEVLHNSVIILDRNLKH